MVHSTYTYTVDFTFYHRPTYEGDVSTKTAALETFKLLLNSVISTAGAKMCTGDISNMYLSNIYTVC
jgi:hypothetical protein